MNKTIRITKYYLYYFRYKHIRHDLIFNILKFIYWIRYNLIDNYICNPIKDRVELSALNYRLRTVSWKNEPKIYRFRRMKYVYQYNKSLNNLYRKNMETIAKISQNTETPQYKLLETLDVNNGKTVYNDNKRYKNNEYSILEPLYYIYELLPTFKQTITAIYDLLIFFKHTFQKYIWNYAEDFYFYYWIQRTLLYRIRGIHPSRASTILYRWEMQKYIHREKRLRREKQIAYYKKLKASLS